MQIADILLAALVAVVAIAGAVALWLGRKSGAAAAEAKALAHDLSITALLSMLRAAAPALVTAAEKAFGEKTGEIKLSWVIGELMKLTPDALKTVFGPVELGCVIDKALADIEPLWSKVPGLTEPDAGGLREIADSITDALADVIVENLAERKAAYSPNGAAAEKEYTAEVIYPGRKPIFAVVRGCDSVDAGLNAEILYPGAEIGIVDDDTTVADRAERLATPAETLPEGDGPYDAERAADAS